MKKLLIASAIALIALNAHAETAITIYSKAQPGAISPSQYRPVAGQANYYRNQSVPGYAVVRDIREVNLPGKKTILKFQDVAALIDPTTVQFRSLTDTDGTKVAEQNFQFDLVSRDKLMQKFIDKEVTVERSIGDSLDTIKGTLLSVDGGITLKMADGSIRTTSNYDDVQFPDLPGGLITKPTLVWEIFTNKTGKHKAEVAYQTEGITWWADYNLTYRDGKTANAGLVDFTSWVSIINQSGATYNDAKLKLMAGDVQRAQSQVRAVPMAYMKSEVAMDSAPAFEEKAFFEYHLYTLNRPATLPQNSTKQLELIPAATDVPVEKLYVYQNGSPWYGSTNYNRGFGGGASGKIGVYLQFKNDKKSGLGEPLPAGRVRVNQRDSADGSLEFIGEDIIQHTARKENVLIKLGNAFDVVGERKQMDYQYDKTRKFVEEEYEIKLRNRKDKAVEVIVDENLGRAANWEILSNSHKWSKENSNKIQFKVTIKPDEEEVVKYRVRYSW